MGEQTDDGDNDRFRRPKKPRRKDEDRMRSESPRRRPRSPERRSNNRKQVSIAGGEKLKSKSVHSNQAKPGLDKTRKSKSEHGPAKRANSRPPRREKDDRIRSKSPTKQPHRKTEEDAQAEKPAGPRSNGGNEEKARDLSNKEIAGSSHSAKSVSERGPAKRSSSRPPKREKDRVRSKSPTKRPSGRNKSAQGEANARLKNRPTNDEKKKGDLNGQEGTGSSHSNGRRRRDERPRNREKPQDEGDRRPRRRPPTTEGTTDRSERANQKQGGSGTNKPTLSAGDKGASMEDRKSKRRHRSAAKSDENRGAEVLESDGTKSRRQTPVEEEKKDSSQASLGGEAELDRTSSEPPEQVSRPIGPEFSPRSTINVSGASPLPNASNSQQLVEKPQPTLSDPHQKQRMSRQKRSDSENPDEQPGSSEGGRGLIPRRTRSDDGHAPPERREVSVRVERTKSHSHDQRKVKSMHRRTIQPDDEGDRSRRRPPRPRPDGKKPSDESNGPLRPPLDAADASAITSKSSLVSAKSADSSVGTDGQMSKSSSHRGDKSRTRARTGRPKPPGSGDVHAEDSSKSVQFIGADKKTQANLDRAGEGHDSQRKSTHLRTAMEADEDRRSRRQRSERLETREGVEHRKSRRGNPTVDDKTRARSASRARKANPPSEEGGKRRMRPEPKAGQRLRPRKDKPSVDADNSTAALTKRSQRGQKPHDSVTAKADGKEHEQSGEQPNASCKAENNVGTPSDGLEDKPSTESLPVAPPASTAPEQHVAETPAAAAAKTVKKRPDHWDRPFGQPGGSKSPHRDLDKSRSSTSTRARYFSNPSLKLSMSDSDLSSSGPAASRPGSRTLSRSDFFSDADIGSLHASAIFPSHYTSASSFMGPDSVISTDTELFQANLDDASSLLLDLPEEAEQVPRGETSVEAGSFIPTQILASTSLSASDGRASGQAEEGDALVWDADFEAGSGATVSLSVSAEKRSLGACIADCLLPPSAPTDSSDVGPEESGEAAHPSPIVHTGSSETKQRSSKDDHSLADAENEPFAHSGRQSHPDTGESALATLFPTTETGECKADVAGTDAFAVDAVGLPPNWHAADSSTPLDWLHAQTESPPDEEFDTMVDTAGVSCTGNGAEPDKESRFRRRNPDRASDTSSNFSVLSSEGHFSVGEQSASDGSHGFPSRNDELWSARSNPDRASGTSGNFSALASSEDHFSVGEQSGTVTSHASFADDVQEVLDTFSTRGDGSDFRARRNNLDRASGTSGNFSVFSSDDHFSIGEQSAPTAACRQARHTEFGQARYEGQLGSDAHAAVGFDAVMEGGTEDMFRNADGDPADFTDIDVASMGNSAKSPPTATPIDEVAGFGTLSDFEDDDSTSSEDDWSDGGERDFDTDDAAGATSSFGARETILKGPHSVAPTRSMAPVEPSSDQITFYAFVAFEETANGHRISTGDESNLFTPKDDYKERHGLASKGESASQLANGGTSHNVGATMSSTDAQDVSSKQGTNRTTPAEFEAFLPNFGLEPKQVREERSVPLGSSGDSKGGNAVKVKSATEDSQAINWDADQEADDIDFAFGDNSEPASGMKTSGAHLGFATTSSEWFGDSFEVGQGAAMPEASVDQNAPPDEFRASGLWNASGTSSHRDSSDQSSSEESGPVDDVAGDFGADHTTGGKIVHAPDESLQPRGERTNHSEEEIDVEDSLEGERSGGHWSTSEHIATPELAPPQSEEAAFEDLASNSFACASQDTQSRSTTHAGDDGFAGTATEGGDSFRGFAAFENDGAPVKSPPLEAAFSADDCEFADVPAPLKTGSRDPPLGTTGKQASSPKVTKRSQVNETSLMVAFFNEPVQETRNEDDGEGKGAAEPQFLLTVESAHNNPLSAPAYHTTSRSLSWLAAYDPLHESRKSLTGDPETSQASSGNLVQTSLDRSFNIWDFVALEAPALPPRTHWANISEERLLLNALASQSVSSDDPLRLELHKMLLQNVVGQAADDSTCGDLEVSLQQLQLLPPSMAETASEELLSRALKDQNVSVSDELYAEMKQLLMESMIGTPVDSSWHEVIDGEEAL